MFTASAAIYDFIYSFKDYATEAAQIYDLITARQRSSGRALLDAACGTGKHAAHLREHYTITLLDLDAELLKIAHALLPEATVVQADMADFKIAQTFDAIVCLFSAIGYVASVERLNATLQRFADHLAPGGVVVVEAWFYPEQFNSYGVHSLVINLPALKITRMNANRVEGRLSFLDFHYLVGTPEGVDYFTENHSLMLFTHEEYLAAFAQAGLAVEYDPEGVEGRGLYIGTKATA